VAEVQEIARGRPACLLVVETDRRASIRSRRRIGENARDTLFVQKGERLRTMVRPDDNNRFYASLYQKPRLLILKVDIVARRADDQRNVLFRKLSTIVA